MRIPKTSLLALIFVCGLFGAAWARPTSNESEVRATVERVFQNLKSKNYDALYENLPASSRWRQRSLFSAYLQSQLLLWSTALSIWSTSLSLCLTLTTRRRNTSCWR